MAYLNLIIILYDQKYQKRNNINIINIINLLLN
jgi:hypothetical protein